MTSPAPQRKHTNATQRSTPYRTIVLPLEGEAYEALITWKDVDGLVGGPVDSRPIVNMGSLGFISIYFHDEFIKLGLPQNPHTCGTLCGVCVLQAVDPRGRTVNIPPSITPANWTEALKNGCYDVLDDDDEPVDIAIDDSRDALRDDLCVWCGPEPSHRSHCTRSRGVRDL
jgi:hypothetical protein